MNLKLFVLLAAGCGTLHAEDWPLFRGPNGNGVSIETNLPTVLNEKCISWKVELPGEGVSSPVIVGDRIYVTCSGGMKQQRLYVVCFNAKDGAKLWERQFWATGRTMCHPKTSVAAPTPAIRGNNIVAIFSSNDVVCLDLDGNLVWLRGLGRDYPNASNSLGMSSSLVISDGVVVAQVENDSESFTVGLDIKTGLNRWKLERPRKPNWTSPVILKTETGELAALQSSEGVVAVEPATGKVVWEYRDGTSSTPSSTPNGPVLLVPSKGLTALQPGVGGKPVGQVWRSSQLRPGTPSPTLVDGKIFTLNDGGILTSGDITNGTRLWQLRLKGPFSASPVSAGKFLYCVNEKGLAQVIDVTKPEGEVVAELDLGQTILATPSISNGAIFFRSDSHLWKLSKS